MSDSAQPQPPLPPPPSQQQPQLPPQTPPPPPPPQSSTTTATTTTGSSRGAAPPLPEKPPSVAERTRLLKSSFRREDGEKPKVPDKPVPTVPDNRTMATTPPTPSPSAAPLASVEGGSGSPSSASCGSLRSSNGERSPSPPPPPRSNASTPTSLGGGSGNNISPNNNNNNSNNAANSMTSSKPPVPEKQYSNTTSSSDRQQSAVVPPATQTKPHHQHHNQQSSSGNNNNNNINQTSEDNKLDVLNAAKRDAFFRAGGGDGPTTKFDPTARYGGGSNTGGLADRERLVKKESNDNSLGEDKERERKYGAETRKELEGYVGFANLPNQVYRKSVKRGFEFTLMVVGESGLGKSTLINSLFLTDLYSSEYPGPSHRIQKTVKVDTTHVTLKENGVQLKLTVVDTPGFGDAVDNSNCWSPVTDFIDSKYEEFLNSESRVNRSTNADTRVHCCLYFIAPTGHGLKPLDVEFMKRLHDKVNIIPLIAKADTLTPDECREFKKTILNEIAQHKIRIYEFPDCEDEEEMKLQKRLRDRVPFAVVGSNRVMESGGKRVRGRQYPWGVVEVENLDHNDFIALRNMVIRTHMQDLKDVTNNVHYENFRYNKLAPSTAEGNKVKPGSLTKDPLTQMAEERQEHNNKMKKMEAEMEQVFEMKVKEKRQKLKDSEADLQKRSEQMKKSLEQQQRELDDKWKEFEKEKAQWEEQCGERRRSLENQKDKKGKKGLF